MKKFSFSKDNKKIILHNLEPKIMIQIIFNNEEEYDEWADVFEHFEFRGNYIVVKWYEDPYEIEEIEDYRLIRSILRRAWGWYRNQMYIPARTFVPGPMETERYKLSLQEGTTDKWIVTDKDNLLCILFDNSKFNDTQRCVLLVDYTAEQVAMLPRYLSQIGDWLFENHSDKI